MITQAGGIQIGYDDVGTGVPLVLVHGFPHNRTLWTPQTSALIDRARCVAPDLRGFGETPSVEPYTVDTYADDVAALVNHLRLGPVVLAGLSMGGYVAFAFWRRHRALVRALILADTRAGADATEARAKRQAHIDLAREKGSRGLADVLIQGMVGATTREKHSGVVDTVYQVMESAPVPGIVGALEAMMGRPDSTLLLLTIDVPTLIVVGEEDVFAPVAESHAMHQAIPGSRLEIIERAGHVSNLERPAAFNHVMSEFLGSVGYD